MGHGLRDFERDVAARRHLAAEGFEHDLLVGRVFHLVHVEFHHVGGVADVVRGHHGGVEFAHGAEHHAVGEDFGLLARVQEDFRLGGHAEFHHEANALEEALHESLERGKVNLGGLVVERVHVEVPCNREGDEVRFVEARVAHVLAVALELALGHFEQAYGTRTVLLVLGNALEEVGEE